MEPYSCTGRDNILNFLTLVAIRIHRRGIQFAVRRWNSDQDQNIKISGEVDATGNGAVTTRIFKNGDEIYSQFINSSSPEGGYEYDIDLQVIEGDFIDFAIDPNANDGSDTTRFTTIITPSESISSGDKIRGSISYLDGYGTLEKLYSNSISINTGKLNFLFLEIQKLIKI